MNNDKKYYDEKGSGIYPSFKWDGRTVYNQNGNGIKVVDWSKPINNDGASMKYRNKPVTREALQWNGDNTKAIIDFCPNVITRSTYLVIPTLEGSHIADVNDYIIKGVKGEFYPCKPDVFEMTYEKVNE